MVAELGDEGGGLDEAGRRERVRADYDAGMKLAEICAAHDITLYQLQRRIKAELWPNRNKSNIVDRPFIITRMFKVLERQVIDLEAEMSDMTRRSQRSGDKEVALLGKLASTLDKLMDLEVRAGGEAVGRKSTKQMKAIHHKLIERIEQLKRG
jgi:hypothetical protein